MGRLVFSDYQGQVIKKDGICYFYTGETYESVTSSDPDEIFDLCGECAIADDSSSSSISSTYLFTTLSQTDVSPILVFSPPTIGDDASWDWGDGNVTIGDNDPTHTYTDGLSSHDVGLFDTDLTDISEIIIGGIQDIISNIDFSVLPNITRIFVGSSPNLGNIDFNTFVNPNLLEVISMSFSSASGNQDISAFNNLEVFTAIGNSIDSVNMPSSTVLFRIFLSFNNISTIDVSSNTILTEIRLDNNNLSSASIDQILIDLDNNGQFSGSFDYSNNPGEGSLTACDAYDNLVGKGWTIIGLAPLGCGSSSSSSTESILAFPYTFPIEFSS